MPEKAVTGLLEIKIFANQRQRGRSTLGAMGGGGSLSHPVNDTTFEKHFSISELKALWSMGRETVRKLVKDEPGVVRIKMGRKQANTTYSIPESVARRIHTRLPSG